MHMRQPLLAKVVLSTQTFFPRWIVIPCLNELCFQNSICDLSSQPSPPIFKTIAAEVSQLIFWGIIFPIRFHVIPLSSFNSIKSSSPLDKIRVDLVDFLTPDLFCPDGFLR